MERNTAGQLTSETVSGEAHAELGLIDHIRNLDRRVREIEVKLFPQADGSGTGRYPDNWTQIGDGTEYPGSYGVGAQSDELKPFVPFVEDSGPIKAGDYVRVIGSDGVVDSAIHSVVSVGADTLVVDDGNSYPRDKVVRVIPSPTEPTQQE
jgi:hypothetical protein